MIVPPLALALIAEQVPRLDLTPPGPVLAPAPQELGVPINTRVWVVLHLQELSELELTLTDVVDGRAIALAADELYRFGDDAGAALEIGLVLTPERPLAPGHAHRVQWRSFTFGNAGESLFVTGDVADLSPPLPPAFRFASPCGPATCGTPYGVRLSLAQGTPDALSALSLATANGVVRGLGRGPMLDVYVGAPDVAVVGTVTALDLAGNRSAPSEVFRATTTEEPAPWWDGSGGCRCLGGERAPLPIGLVALVALVALVGRRAARGSSC